MNRVRPTRWQARRRQHYHFGESDVTHDFKDLNWDDVKKGLKKFLPTLKAIAAITPNTYDDKAVAFLEALLAEQPEALKLIPPA